MQKEIIEIESAPVEKHRIWKILIIILIIILLLAIIIALSFSVYEYIIIPRNETNVTTPDNTAPVIPNPSLTNNTPTNLTNTTRNTTNPDNPPDTPSDCTSNCSGKQCGGDGCGGTCAPGCGVGYECNSTGNCAQLINCTADSNCTYLTAACGKGLCNQTIKQCYASYNSSSAVCRNNISECDAAEMCAGNSVSCQDDLNKSNGAVCSIGTCHSGKCSSSCTNDYRCTSAGSFCDGNLIYTCTLGGDGCFDRVNGSECGGKSCLNGACVAGCSASGTGFADTFDNTDCINLASAVNVVFGSGVITANGITPGELEAEPTMQGLYHFNIDPLYLEDDVRLAYDFSGKGRNAWAYSDYLYSADGKFGKAYDFRRNGSPKSFLISKRDINQDNWTFSFWIKLSENTTNVSGSARLFGNNAFILSYSSNLFDFIFPNSQHLYSTKLNWTNNSWHHVAVKLKAGNNSIYIDGNRSGNHTYSGGFNYTTNFYIGWWGGSFPSVNLSMDEFAIWNRVLEEDEIESLARGERIRTGEIESNWINSGYFDSIKATLSGTETTKILFTCNGTDWEELQNGNWETYHHHYQLPCSKFKYKLEFSGGKADSKADSIIFEWKNETESSSFSFFVYGDSHDYDGSSGITHEEIVNLISKVDPELVLHHGDFWGNKVAVNLVNWKAVLRTIQSLLKRRTKGLEATYFASVGNHDAYVPLDGPEPLDGYFDVFNYPPHRTLSPVDPSFVYYYDYLPSNLTDPDDPKYYDNPYYSFKYKNSCFISLYMYDVDNLAEYHGTADIPANEIMTHVSKRPIPDPTNLSRATPQYKWLYYALKNCSEDPSIIWKFVYFHFPPFSSGGFNRNPDTEFNHTAYLRQHLVPLLEYFNVSIVFSGHEHDYERTYPIKEWYNETKNFNEGIINPDGIVYIVDGNAGNAGDVNFNSSVFKNYTAFGLNAVHATKITIDGNNLYGATILINGTWIDNFTMSLSALGATTATRAEIRGSSVQEERATLSLVSQIYNFFKGFLTGNTIKEITGYFLKIKA